MNPPEEDYGTYCSRRKKGRLATMRAAPRTLLDLVRLFRLHTFAAPRRHFAAHRAQSLLHARFAGGRAV